MNTDNSGGVVSGMDTTTDATSSNRPSGQDAIDKIGEILESAGQLSFEDIPTDDRIRETAQKLATLRGRELSDIEDEAIIEEVAHRMGLRQVTVRNAVKKPNMGEWRDKGLSLGDILAETITTPTWIIENAIRTNVLNTFAGASKAGKSRLALEALRSIFTGEPFLGEFEVAPGPHRVVLFTADDDTDQLKKLTQDWARERAIPTDAPMVQHFNPEGLDFTDVRSFRHVEEYLERLEAGGWKPALVVFDSSYNYMRGLVDNAGEEVKPVYGKLRDLAERHRVAVLLVEHSAKQAGQRGHAINGSQFKSAQIRSGINVYLEDEEYTDPSTNRVVSLVRCERWGNTGRQWIRNYLHDGERFTWARTEDSKATALIHLIEKIDKAKALATTEDDHWVALTDLEESPNKRTQLRKALGDEGFELERRGRGGAWYVRRKDDGDDIEVTPTFR